MSRRRAEIGARRILPLEYQQVEYLEGTGSQYIDTGYMAEQSTKIKTMVSCKFNNKRVFGARRGDNGDQQFELIAYDNTRFGFIIRLGNSGNILYKPTINNYNYEIEISTRYAKINNTDITFSQQTLTSTYRNIVLFAGNFPSGITDFLFGKIYYFQMYQNNTLCIDFIPAYRISDNKPCMYDLVTRQPFFNQGSGEFTIGPAIY